jgi:hypothetical protein
MKTGYASDAFKVHNHLIYDNPTNFPSGTTLSISAGEVGIIGSSRRFKTDIEPLSLDADKILELRPVKFRWLSNGEEDFGLIAEEVDEIFPKLVARDKDNLPFTVKYEKLGVLLLQLAKKQQANISELQTKIDSQQKDIDTLKEEIRLLKDSSNK